MCDPSISTKIIVSSLFLNEEELANAEELLHMEVDWHLLFAIAEYNMVLCRSLRKLLSAFEFELKTEEREVRRRLIFWEERAREALALIFMVQEVLRKADVDFVVIKTLDYYPDVKGDIDILIAREDLEKAKEALFKLEAKPYLYRHFIDEFPEKGHLLLKESLFEIELYPKVTCFGEEYLSEGRVIENSRHTIVEGTSICVPSPEDALLIGCIHSMYRHGGVIKISDSYNVTCLLREKKVDWKYLFNSSSEKGTTMGLMYFLWLVNYVYSKYSKKILLPSALVDYLNQHFGSRERLEVEEFPYRIPLSVLFLIFAYKFLFDIHRFKWYSAVNTLRTCFFKTIGRMLYFTFKSARRYDLLRRFGWHW